jgi:predicted RNase H-like HicB family nuclease
MPTNKRKKILVYPAIFEPAAEGGYNVSFPSFPGCVTFGKTFEEAKKNAHEVLELWLEENGLFVDFSVIAKANELGELLAQRKL